MYLIIIFSIFPISFSEGREFKFFFVLYPIFIFTLCCSAVFQNFKICTYIVVSYNEIKNLLIKLSRFIYIFFVLFFPSAFKYEIRCYTNRDALNQEATFTKHGILVHDSFTPQPLEYGTAQTCTVGVPWPNEVIYYGLVSIDEAGNRSPISNILSVYIYEAPTTTTTTTTTTTSDPLTGDAVPLYGSEVRHTNGGTTHHNHGMAWSKHMRVYIGKKHALKIYEYLSKDNT